MDAGPKNGVTLDGYLLRRKPSEWSLRLQKLACSQAVAQLAFVATLTAFTEVHAIGDWTTLLNFFGFFVLLWWSWFAQVNYDIHFETEDLAHRLFKLLQLCGLGYLAGATGGWDLSKVSRQE